MEIFKVPLYQVSYSLYSYSEVSYVDNIIVFKKFGRIREVLTGYSKFDIFSKEMVSNGKLYYYYCNSIREEKEGAHLFLYDSSFCAMNRVTEKELDEYMKKYDDSCWKKKYEDMKVLTKDEKKRLKKRVNDIFESKK